MSPPVVDVPVAPEVARAAGVVPEGHYTHHEERGVTVHRTNPVFVHRDLSSLAAAEGMNVLEVGTGSGYSGALLGEIVGPGGSVTSLDIDPYLTRWANLIHHRRGLTNVRCHAADGTAGYPAAGPYDRIGAWCSPPLLPRAWVDQAAERCRIVATLPIARVPDLTVLAVLTITGGRPEVETIMGGNYIDATAAPKADLEAPGGGSTGRHGCRDTIGCPSPGGSGTTGTTPVPAPPWSASRNRGTSSRPPRRRGSPCSTGRQPRGMKG
ncbi:hypothetical protein FNQ90_20750 [Streptomyces alkaliphilus]|uniref:Protein-L-isoaspartate O-methyltransferase n=1 Tax=Streptomyces alkaliphilus TaxID=1472722 RepID=A0A7W3TGL0_9ACTN|nr:hypothetical protein [Streptomyces alkaliphilus]MBB0246473.1 hypothetical protein [Streptomyces alkaliphilus]